MQILDVLQKKHVPKILLQLRGGLIRFTDLQNKTGINTSGLQDRLYMLHKEGFVKHKNCNVDRRSGYYSLTQKGVKVAEKLTEIENIK